MVADIRGRHGAASRVDAFILRGIVCVVRVPSPGIALPRLGDVVRRTPPAWRTISAGSLVHYTPRVPGS